MQWYFDKEKWVQIYNLITDALEENCDKEHKAFWVNQDGDIECKTKFEANVIADFLEDCGFDTVATSYNENLDIWEVYPV